MKKKLLIIIACLVAVAGVFFGIYMPDSDINNTLDNIEDKIVEEIQEENKKEIIVSEESEEIVRDTIQATEEGEDLSTTEIIESSEEEEIHITDEGALETDAVVEQENISYDGVNTGNGLSLLGKYQGLTYYSQADSRWANVIYSSIGDRSQTMKSSACGPTSAAIVVSSSKGTILPTTMANLFVDNGYRTSNNGTAWAAFPFVADYFNFNEYHTTSNFDTMISYLKQKNDNGSSKYYVVASCASGLFTSGGHYIVLVGDSNGTITVYDPYLYTGKFTTASRRAAGATVSGNSVFVSESSFKKYANYRNFWIFSNDSGSGNINTNSSNETLVNYTRYVATENANLNVRNGAGTNYSIITSLKKGTRVNVTKVKGEWSYITSPAGWVSTQYLSAGAVTTSSNTNSSYNVKITASALNIRTGASKKYSIVGTYKKGTVVTITNTSNGWGKTAKGWIYLGYTTKISSTSSTNTSTTNSNYTTGTYKVTASLLNVRTGAGTNYRAKTYKDLSSNAKNQNKALGNYYANGYLKGVVCTVTKVSGNWGYTPSGWICLIYCKKI